MTVTIPFGVRQEPLPAAPPPQSARDMIRDQIRQGIQQAQAEARAGAAARPEVRVGREVIVRPGAVIAPEVIGQPGTTVQWGTRDDGIPPQVVDLAYGFFVMCAVMVIGWPIARAMGRRLERSGERTALEPAVAAQLQRIEHAVDAMAIEVERISESQRFMARIQSGSTAERV